jgi:uncharacterized protein (UPF0332 family)
LGRTINPEFRDCVEKGKIKRFSRARALVGKELEAAAWDLERAGKSLKEGDFKWSTIQSYYSMFHSGRALIYQKGYRERSHYCLIVALRHLYVGKGLLSYHLVDGLAKGKGLRENADYDSNWSELGAQAMVKMAGELLEAGKKVLAQQTKQTK